MKILTGNPVISSIIIIVCISGILCSCQQTESKKPSPPDNNHQQNEEISTLEKPLKSSFNINFPELINQTKDVYLSDLVKSIRYVPLETTSKYLIGEQSVCVKPCGELIFVSEFKKPIGVFDLNGNFLHTIGKTGKGPGEFNFDYVFWPDETTRKIYVSNVNIKGITTFSFEGEYLGDLSLEPHSMAFVPLGNDRFLSWTFRQQKFDEKLFRIFFHDETGSIYSRYYEAERENDLSNGVFIMHPHFTLAPEGVLSNSWEEDQIMRATPDGKYEVALSWSLGKYKIPFEPSSDFKRFGREGHKYINDVNAWESFGNFYIQFNHKKKLNLAVLNKYNEEFYIVANPDTAQTGVYNDINGGPSFWPSWYSDKGKRFFKLFQAIDLIDGELDPDKKVVIKDQAAANHFLEMVANLDKNSNPVLVIVEMK